MPLTKSVRDQSAEAGDSALSASLGFANLYQISSSVLRSNGFDVGSGGGRE